MKTQAKLTFRPWTFLMTNNYRTHVINIITIHATHVINWLLQSMQHTLYLNRSKVFFSSLLELLPLLGLVVIGPNERMRAGGWCGIGVTVPPASTVSTACLHTSNMSRPHIPTTPYTGLSRRPHASSKRDRNPTANRTTNT